MKEKTEGKTNVISLVTSKEEANTEVIEMLETILESAKKGEIMTALVVTMDQDEVPEVEYCTGQGIVSLLGMCRFAEHEILDHFREETEELEDEFDDE